MYLPQLSPYAFFIGPYGVHWYSLFMALSMVIGVWYLVRAGSAAGVNPDTLYDLAFWVIISGIVGARLVFVATSDPSWFWTDPIQVLRVWTGGLAIHGAVGGGLLAAWIYLRRHPEISYGKVLDWMVPGVAAGIFLVRIGNIFNHEILGRTTELGFGRWPTQPMEMVIGLVLILRYFRLERRNPPPGVQFWSAIFYYQVMRGFGSETFKADPLYIIHYVNPVLGIGFTTLTQLFTPAILAVAGYFWWRAAHLGRVRHETRSVENGPA